MRWPELHELCEALVILAFGTANPKYEKAADADKEAAVLEPLPACFQSLLEKKILVNAKRDELAKMKTYIEKDRVVLKKIRPRRDACRELFEKECAEDTSVPKGPVPKCVTADSKPPPPCLLYTSPSPRD